MAYIGKGPAEVLSGVASKSTFTGDGSTTTFDISTDIPAGGENDIQVFVDNVRQEPGSGASYTVGVDGSGNLRRITFNVAPEASQSIYVINPRRIEAVGAIPDNSVTAGKISPNAISGQTELAEAAADTDAYLIYDTSADQVKKILASNVTPNETLITGKTELAEEAANGDFFLIYDSSAGTLKKIQRSNVTLQGPTVSSVSPTSVTSGDGTGNYTFTITGTNFTGASANLVNTSGTTVAFDTVTVNSATQITGVIAKSSLPNSGEPYDVKVSAQNGLNSVLENQINIDASPTFNTASGSLGTLLNGLLGSTTLTVEAFDPESAGNVTFELQSGSLPAGASITTVHENGVSKANISGFSAVGSNTTSNFVLRAVDAASNTSSRSFSITVNAAVSESFTSSGTFSVPSGVAAVDVLIVAGGGGAPRQHASGGGAGGLIFMPAYPLTAGGTITVTVGCGGSEGLGSGGATNGQDSVFGSPGDPGFSPTSSILTAKGGGFGGHYSTAGTGPAGGPGGSGGGAGVHEGACGVNSNVGSATQPTQPGNSGAYGFGNAGGQSQSPGPFRGGGGGGAGAVGGNYEPNKAGDGGAGKAYTIADGTTPVYYAGGGGGGAHSVHPGGNGGQGGGGDGNGYGGGPLGVGSPSGTGQPGTANRGGGGGSSAASDATAGGGGKGIVIVRY
jgi:hypothetical protein